MTTTLEIIKSLAATTKRNEKLAILELHKENTLLNMAFEMAYNPYLNFWIKKIPEYVPGVLSYYDLSTAMQDLVKLADRIYTGHAAIDFLKEILETLPEEDAKVIELIIKKDLNCGVSVATINKVWPNLIPEFKLIMKCHDSIEHIKYPAFVQTKYDGARCIIQCLDQNTGDYLAYSSSGAIFSLGQDFNEFVKTYMKTGEYWDGEVVAYENGEPLSRQVSNGLTSKALKNTATEQELSYLVFIVWDIIDQSGTIEYKDRFYELGSRFVCFGIEGLITKGWVGSARIQIAETHIINSEQEAFDHFQKMLNEGLEGSIVKNSDGKWSPKRVKHQGKMKDEIEVDLLITGWESHIKNESMLGSFIFSAFDQSGQELLFNVGSGITKEMRESDPKSFLGKVATVRFNKTTRNKKTPDIFTLYIPRVIEIRFDKTEGDSVERILELEKIKNNNEDKKEENL